MPNVKRLAVALGLMLTVALPLAAQAPTFVVEEATIAGVHAAMRAGTVSCRQLVTALLRRVEAYDRNGPAINALITLNPPPSPWPTRSTGDSPTRD